MIRENEIDELKKHLGSDGKLIISNDLTEKQIERYQFINSLNVDLLSVLSRESKSVDYNDEETDNTTYVEDASNDDIENLENSYTIDEDDTASVEELNNFF